MIYKKFLFFCYMLIVSMHAHASDAALIEKNSQRINGVRYDTPAVTMIEEDDQRQLVRSSCFRKPPKEIKNANRAAHYLLYVCLREKNKKKWCYLPLEMFRADGSSYKGAHDNLRLEYEKGGKKIIKTYVLDTSFTFAQHHFIQWIKEVDAENEGCCFSCF